MTKKDVLCHKGIVDSDDVDVLDSFRLVLVIVLDVLRYLETAGVCERARNTELECTRMRSVSFDIVQTRTMMFFPLRSSVKLFSGSSSLTLSAGISPPTPIWLVARTLAAAECATRAAPVTKEAIAEQSHVQSTNAVYITSFIT